MDEVRRSASVFSIGRNDGDSPLSVTRIRDAHDSSTRRMSFALYWLTASIRSAERRALRMAEDQNGWANARKKGFGKLVSGQTICMTSWMVITLFALRPRGRIR